MGHGKYWLWALGSLLWTGVIVYLARNNWPVMSMDLPANDPQVRAAFSQAVTAHVLRYAGLALSPPALAYIVARSGGTGAGR